MRYTVHLKTTGRQVVVADRFRIRSGLLSFKRRGKTVFAAPAHEVVYVKREP